MPKRRRLQLREVSELPLKQVELKSIQSVHFRAVAVEFEIGGPGATWDAVWCPSSAYRTDKYLAGQLEGLHPAGVVAGGQSVFQVPAKVLSIICAVQGSSSESAGLLRGCWWDCRHPNVGGLFWSCLSVKQLRCQPKR